MPFVEGHREWSASVPTVLLEPLSVKIFQALVFRIFSNSLPFFSADHRRLPLVGGRAARIACSPFLMNNLRPVIPSGYIANSVHY